MVNQSNSIDHSCFYHESISNQYKDKITIKTSVHHPTDLRILQSIEGAEFIISEAMVIEIEGLATMTVDDFDTMLNAVLSAGIYLKRLPPTWVENAMDCISTQCVHHDGDKAHRFGFDVTHDAGVIKIVPGTLDFIDPDDDKHVSIVADHFVAFHAKCLVFAISE
jgi:hypothetical protein